MVERTYEQTYSLRLLFLALLSFILIGLLAVRLFVLQVLSHEYYTNLAQNQHQLNKVLVPNRGEIFIRDRFSDLPYPVVTNINRPLVYVVPQQVEDAPALSKTLSQIFGLEPREILQKITDDTRKYVPIIKEISEEQAERLAQLKLPGVFFEDQIRQRFPEGQLAASVLGFVAFEEHERKGRYGIEKYFDQELTGLPGSLAGSSDPRGVWITGQRDLVPAVDGIDLILTLDRAIQYKVEEVLAKAVAIHGAKAGSVIVQNPKTGAILAMANFPTFDPNEFNIVADPAVYNNTSIQTNYEPGSVMKPITFAVALEEEAITPDLTYEDPGAVNLENFTIKNADNKKHGTVTMTQVLEESINTGAIFVEQQIGHKKFRSYLEKFRFGQKTDITLPFEATGSISNLYKGGDLYPATIAFGQGMTATPLQILTAYSAIANGGKLYKPFIVETMVYPSGQEETTRPALVAEAISPKTASVLGAMLVSVVEKGHGKRAGVSGYFIAGKTGTAQVAYEDRAGYDPNRTIGTFLGFGPVDDPVFSMIVKIEEPQDVRFAESTAAPVFGEIAQFILNYYQIPKSRE